MSVGKQSLSHRADGLTPIEEQIQKRAYTFDLYSLLDLLRHIGYSDDEMEFASHDSLVHQSAVIAAIVFRKEPRRRVYIALNLGWLAAQSPLPNYFRKVLLAQREDCFSSFLGLFCHRLLRATTIASFPERDRTVFQNWPKIQKQLLSLLGLRSTYTIHWVFSQVFPELEVAIGRSIIEREIRTTGIELGVFRFGDGSVLGGVSKILVTAVAVTLFASEVACGQGFPWSEEALRRVNQHIFPVLSAHGCFLDVKLVLRDQTSFLKLEPHRYLGFEPLQSPSMPNTQTQTQTKNARTIVLYQGEVQPLTRQVPQ